MTDFSREEFLAVELQERLRSFNCNVPYDMAREQVRSFVAADAATTGVPEEQYLSDHTDDDLVGGWIERVLAVATHLSGEVDDQYPLLAMPSTDAGNLIGMLATTLHALEGVPGCGDIVSTGLQVIAALGKQVAAAEGDAQLCLLTQPDTFALSLAVQSLMALPPDVRCDPHLQWVASCAAMLDSCFTEIAEQQGAGEDLSSPDRRVFVVSMSDDENDV